jgi:hypothetical protein
MVIQNIQMVNGIIDYVYGKKMSDYTKKVALSNERVPQATKDKAIRALNFVSK